ncbi:type II toxin-antitoxin system RelE/ParE family toxin [Aliihoeflea sp. PC F10.4]
MPLELAFTRQAETDFEDIATFVSHRSMRGALTFVESIERASGIIGNHPHAGRLAPETGNAQVRRFAIPPYSIYYRILNDRLEILRLLHGARDLNEADFEEIS